MSSDEYIMPFGKHKGTRMKSVPAHYLDWLIGQPWIKDWPKVERYIVENKKAIAMDLENDVDEWDEEDSCDE